MPSVGYTYDPALNPAGRRPPRRARNAQTQAHPVSLSNVLGNRTAPSGGVIAQNQAALGNAGGTKKGKTGANPTPATPSAPPQTFQDKLAALFATPGATNGGSYNDQYASSLSAARGNIESALSQSLAEIGQREAASGQALDAMPGQLNTIYGDAQNSMNSAQAAINQAAAGSGMQNGISPDATMAPIQAAMSGGLASRLSDVPLLRNAFTGAYSKQRQDAQGQYASAMSDLNMREAEANRSSGSNDLSDYGKALLDNLQNGDDSNNTLDNQFGVGHVGTDRGKALAQQDTLRASQIRSGTGTHGSPGGVYRSLSSDLRSTRSITDPNKKAARIQQIVQSYQDRYPNRSSAISLALFDSGL